MAIDFSNYINTYKGSPVLQQQFPNMNDLDHYQLYLFTPFIYSLPSKFNSPAQYGIRIKGRQFLDHEWEENDELYYENEADKYPEPPPKDDEDEEFMDDYDEDEDAHDEL